MYLTINEVIGVVVVGCFFPFFFELYEIACSYLYFIDSVRVNGRNSNE